MSNEYVLKKIALNDNDSDVRIAAIQKLNSERHEYVLKQIATNDKDPQVREAAVYRLG